MGLADFHLFAAPDGQGDEMELNSNVKWERENSDSSSEGEERCKHEPRVVSRQW